MKLITNDFPDYFRFYSFVAGLYLSPLQCGLQTAHTVSEMYVNNEEISESVEAEVFYEWAQSNKTIVICNALNSQGVIDAYRQITMWALMFNLPHSIFHEDEQSLGGAATACAVIIPVRFFAAEYNPANPRASKKSKAGKQSYFYDSVDGRTVYPEDTAEFELIKLIKSYRLV